MTKRGICTLISLLAALVLLLVGFGCAASTPTPTPTPTLTTTTTTTTTTTIPPTTTTTTTTTATPTVMPTGTLTIGSSYAMSGSAASWGLAYTRGVATAIEDINAKGGVIADGKKYLLAMKAYDHAYDPAKALEIAKRMITVDKVFMISTHGATVTKPIIPYTEANKTIVTHLATGRDVMTFQPEKYTYSCVMIGSPNAMMMILPWVNKNRPDIKTISYLKPDDASGWDDGKDMDSLFPQYGITIVNKVFYKRGITDFYPVLTKLLATKADAIDLGSQTPGDMGLVIKQARELGFTGQFIAPTVADITAIIAIAGKAMEGTLYAPMPDPNGTNATPEEKAFYERVMQAYGFFDRSSFMVVEGIYPVFQAVQATGSTDPDKVANWMSTNEFTVLGRKSHCGGVSIFGAPARQILYPLLIATVENGKEKALGLLEVPAGF